MKLDDSVLVRIVQIIQEAMLTGTDCVDYMRLIELETSENDKLVLTQNYVDTVKKEHNDLVEFAKTQQTT
jgi:hypothetical protein